MNDRYWCEWCHLLVATYPIFWPWKAYSNLSTVGILAVPVVNHCTTNAGDLTSVYKYTMCARAFGSAAAAHWSWFLRFRVEYHSCAPKRGRNPKIDWLIWSELRLLLIKSDAIKLLVELASQRESVYEHGRSPKLLGPHFSGKIITLTTLDRGRWWRLEQARVASL